MIDPVETFYRVYYKLETCLNWILYSLCDTREEVFEALGHCETLDSKEGAPPCEYYIQEVTTYNKKDFKEGAPPCEYYIQEVISYNKKDFTRLSKDKISSKGGYCENSKNSEVDLSTEKQGK